MENASLHWEFMKLMHRMRRGAAALSACGLGRMEFFALEALHGARGLSASALAAVLCMSGPAVSRMLRGLEKGGLILRSIDPDDRRNIVVRLTDAGNGARMEAHARLCAIMNRAAEKMGPEDMRALLTLFARLADILEAEAERSNKGEDACEN